MEEDILIINECDCGCHCGEVELRSDHQPDVLLMDEYAEPYENDIVKIREIAEEWEETGTRETNATANKNAILNAISAAKAEMLAVENSNSDKLDTLLERTISFPERATQEQLDSLF